MSLEDKIKALMESKKEDTKKEPAEKEVADKVDDVPAVVIENPMDPDVQIDEPKEEKKVEESTIDSTSIDSLLTEEFSDEFKMKAKVIFEAAIKEQMTKIEEELMDKYTAKEKLIQEEFDKKLADKVSEITEETSEKIDGYLSYVAEEWSKDNALAIERGVKTELTESFINSLKTVFVEHYIDMPEDKVDLYEQALTEKEDLEKSMATILNKMKGLTEELAVAKRDHIIEESVKGYSGLDAERLKMLVEDFEFDDEISFRKRVDIVKKSFFSKQPKETREQISEEFTKSVPIVEDTTEIILENEIKHNPQMSSYLNAIKRSK